MTSKKTKKRWTLSSVDCVAGFRAGVVGKQNTPTRRRRATVHAVVGADRVRTACAGAEVSEFRPVSLLLAARPVRSWESGRACPRCQAIVEATRLHDLDEAMRDDCDFDEKRHREQTKVAPLDLLAIEVATFELVRTARYALDCLAQDTREWRELRAALVPFEVAS